jgi:hypothetical protein
MLAFENFANGFGRAFLAQEFVRLIAQHFLIVGEIEVHRPTLLEAFIKETIEGLSPAANAFNLTLGQPPRAAFLNRCLSACRYGCMSRFRMGQWPRHNFIRTSASM